MMSLGIQRLLTTCLLLWIATSSVVLTQDLTSTPHAELLVNNISTTEAHTAHRVPCPSGAPPLGYDGYCLHGGECLYLAEIGEASCRCLEVYWGHRCQYHIPFSQAGQKSELRDSYIAIGVLAGLLSLLLVAGLVILVRRCRSDSSRARPGHVHLEKGCSTDKLTEDV